MKEYALYDGDTFIALGTIKEIAAYTGMKVDAVRYLAKKSYKERVKDKKEAKILIELEE